VHRRRGREPPESVARRRVERHEVAVVGADEYAASPDGGRGVDVRPGPLRPEQSPARRPERVERPVGVADEHSAVGDRRRRIEVLAPAEAAERRRSPPLASRARVEGIEAAPVGPEVDLPAAVGRRAVDLAVGRERPADFARVDVEGVELVIPRPGVQRPADHERGRLEGAGTERPDELAGARRHRGDHPRLAARIARAWQRLHPGVVNDAVGDRWRRGGAVVEPALPDDLSRAVVDGVEASPLLREVQAAVRDRGRKFEHVTGLEHPAEAERRLQLEVGRRMRALDLETVRRPRQTHDDPPGTLLLGRLLRGDELLGRGALHVVDRRLVVQPEAEGDPEPERARHGHRDQVLHPGHGVPG
jgi:hypothetical protein